MNTKLLKCNAPEIMPDRSKYKLLSNVTAEYTYKGDRKYCTAPMGYTTDGATIPRVFWTFVGSPFQPKFMQAAIIHDWMCNGGYSVDEMSNLFYCILIDNGVGKIRARIMERAVRAFTSIVL